MASRGARVSTGNTIKSSREIQEIFSAARRVAHPCVIALIVTTPEGRGQGGRVAFVAGKKLGNAVVRNRSKRVLREALRRAGGPRSGHDVVLIAREATAHASSAELDKALEDVFGRAGVSG